MPRTQRSSQEESQFSADDLKEMTSDVVFYLLTHESKRGLTKKADVLKACNLSAKPTAIKERVLKMAYDKLLHVFGLQWLELLPEEKKGLYVLFNKISRNHDPETQHLEFDDRENCQLGLLYSILSLIFMSNDVVRDDVLFKFLRQMGVWKPDMEKKNQNASSGDIPQDVYGVFGNVKDLIHKEWGAKHRYLAIKQVDNVNPDEPSFEYRWGERAKMEIKRSKILQLIADMYECDVKAFKTQYDQVVEEEGKEVFQE